MRSRSNSTSRVSPLCVCVCVCACVFVAPRSSCLSVPHARHANAQCEPTVPLIITCARVRVRLCLVHRAHDAELSKLLPDGSAADVFVAADLLKEFLVRACLCVHVCVWVHMYVCGCVSVSVCDDGERLCLTYIHTHTRKHDISFIFTPSPLPSNRNAARTAGAARAQSADGAPEGRVCGMASQPNTVG